MLDKLLNFLRRQLGSGVRLRGDVTVIVRDAKLGTETRRTKRNTITYTGTNAVLYLLAQDGVTASDYQIVALRFGANGTPPTRGNTGLGAPGFSYTLLPSDRTPAPATGELVITASLGLGDAAGEDLREVGLILGNGSLFARQIIPAVENKTSAQSVEVEWRITVRA
jgi:hypothetical protein